MGGFITIGLVFDDLKTINSELIALVYYLQKKELLIHNLKYSKDTDGIYWMEESEDLKFNEKVCEKMIKNYFPTLTLKGKFINDKEIKFNMILEKFEVKGFCFLFEIEMSELFDVVHKIELELYTNLIIELFKDLFKCVKYSYGYCDHEAYIDDYSDAINSQKSMFSIFVRAINNNLNFELAPWQIDGLSERINIYKF